MIYFSIYRLKLIPQEPLVFPAGNAGTALRGAFGHLLKKIVCIDKNADCLTCPVTETCVFQIVFYPVRSKNSPGPKRQRTPPRGFVIKPPLNNRAEYPPGEPFVFDFLLVGRLASYLPYIIVPFKELGRIGLGAGRGKFVLDEIASVKPVVGGVMCEKDPSKKVAEQDPSPLMGEGGTYPVGSESVTLKPSPLRGEGRVGVNLTPLPPPTRGECRDSASGGLDLSSPFRQQERRDRSLDLSMLSGKQERIESIYHARDGVVRNVNGRVTLNDLMSAPSESYPNLTKSTFNPDLTESPFNNGGQREINPSQVDVGAYCNTPLQDRSPTTTEDVTRQNTPCAKPLRLTLNFLTPTQIKYNPTGEKGKSQIVREPEFHHIAKRLRDRIDALAVYYCDGPLNIDYKGFGERAEKVRTISRELHWCEQSRRSRQGHQHDLSGFVGKITFEGDLQEYLPFLILGQYLHVGENAVFGSGRYGVETKLEGTL